MKRKIIFILLFCFLFNICINIRAQESNKDTIHYSVLVNDLVCFEKNFNGVQSRDSKFYFLSDSAYHYILTSKKPGIEHAWGYIMFNNHIILKKVIFDSITKKIINNNFQMIEYVDSSYLNVNYMIIRIVKNYLEYLFILREEEIFDKLMVIFKNILDREDYKHFVDFINMPP